MIIGKQNELLRKVASAMDDYVRWYVNEYRMAPPDLRIATSMGYVGLVFDRKFEDETDSDPP